MAGGGGGGSAGAPAADSGATLARITVRRARLLELVGSAPTNAVIAAQLGIQPATVKRHLDDVRRVTGRRTKPQLAYWWAEHREAWWRLHRLPIPPAAEPAHAARTAGADGQWLVVAE